MKYIPPIGGAANDPYIDANPATGVEGSPVPAAAIEDPQREIVNVIIGTGLTPDENDHTQLHQAIQRLIAGGYKASVRAATTANIGLTGVQTIDGVAVVAADRVLVKDQTAAAENGIYVVAAGAWARAEDANTAGSLTSGVLVPVESGTANADTIWMLTTDGTITIGTTAQTWQIKSGDASTTRKGQVQLATNAEAQALTNALNAITPATLAAALQGSNQSFAGNGYQKLPGGLIMQWGNFSFTTAGGWSSATLTFPIAFPNACTSINSGLVSTLVGSGTAGGSTGEEGLAIDSLTSAGFRQWMFDSQSGSNAFRFIAIGY